MIAGSVIRHTKECVYSNYLEDNYTCSLTGNTCTVLDENGIPRRDLCISSNIANLEKFIRKSNPATRRVDCLVAL